MRQQFYDAEAGDKNITPSMPEPQQRVPPPLGLHPFGDLLGHKALRTGVYSIQQMFGADYRAALQSAAGEGPMYWLVRWFWQPAT
jgi:hypothetical protein